MKQTAEEELKQGTADLVCFGRWYLANPDFPVSPHPIGFVLKNPPVKNALLWWETCLQRQVSSSKFPYNDHVAVKSFIMSSSSDT